MKQIKEELKLDLKTFNELTENFKFKKDKTDIDELNNCEIIKNNTIIIDEDIETADLFSKYNLSMEVMRNIGYSIDFNCSGSNVKNHNIYKLFNSFFELQDHFRRQHNKKIKKNSVLINYKTKNTMK